MSEELSERLEIRLAYLERGQQELSDQMYAQEQLIERLEAALKRLSERVAELAATAAGPMAEDPPPPHY